MQHRKHLSKNEHHQKQTTFRLEDIIMFTAVRNQNSKITPSIRYTLALTPIHCYSLISRFAYLRKLISICENGHLNQVSFSWLC